MIQTSWKVKSNKLRWSPQKQITILYWSKLKSTNSIKKVKNLQFNLVFLGKVMSEKVKTFWDFRGKILNHFSSWNYHNLLEIIQIRKINSPKVRHRRFKRSNQLKTNYKLKYRLYNSKKELLIKLSRRLNNKNKL